MSEIVNEMESRKSDYLVEMSTRSHSTISFTVRAYSKQDACEKAKLQHPSAFIRYVYVI